MWKIFRKAFWVPYEDGRAYPTIEKAQEAIAEYCEKNGHTYSFPNPEEAVIDGVAYEICRGIEPGSRGSYGVKCREK